MAVERIISIGGCPRSGTTLVGSALGGGARCIVSPEAQFLGDLAVGIETGAVAPDVRSIRHFLANHWRFKLWGVPLEERPLELPRGADRWEAMRLVLGDLLGQYAERQGKPDARVWIDHTPDNFRVHGAIDRAFPDTTYVHLVRDGRGVLASVLPLDWGPDDPEAGATWWTGCVAHGLALEGALPDRAIQLRFEQFVTYPELELRRVCAFAGIEYDPAMSEGNGLRVPAYTKAQHARIGGGIDPAVATNWKRSLTTRELEIFEYYAGSLLELLGYARVTGRVRPEADNALGGDSYGMSLLEKIRYRVIRRPLRALSNRVTRGRRRKQGLRAAAGTAPG